MSNQAYLTLTSNYGEEYTLNDVISFKVVKEYYTPYTTLTVSAVCPTSVSGMFKKVELILNGKTIHSGFVDVSTIDKTPNHTTINITSKSFTALLCQNQLEPGLKDRLTIGSLIESFITIPEISYEDNDTQVNYIYVKSNSTLWDAVVNLTHKVNNGHPYVRENNKVMVSLDSNAPSLTLTESMVTSAGFGLDTTRIISHVHMQDTEGTYSTYNLSNPSATELNIVRHKHIDLDRQYLSNPPDALTHRINFSMRGYQYVYATYNGYYGEDIGDYLNLYNYYPKCRVSKVVVNGKDGNVSTKVYAYTDNYLTYNS
jgi:hypothetical protein